MFKNLIKLCVKVFKEKKLRLPITSDFLNRGGIPWTPGYEEYKWCAIEDVISGNKFCNVIGTPGYGYRIDERVVELPWLFSRLPEGPAVLLDAGSALNHLPLLSHPRLTEKKLFISTLAPERNSHWERGISYIYEDLRQTCLRENLFDLIACISTLEHVGLDNTFLYTDNPEKKEMDVRGHLPLVDVFRSLLKTGGRLFISVPFGTRKNHGWFQVFDGAMLDELVSRFAPSTCAETIFTYRDDRWKIASREECKDATCFDINKEKKYPSDYCAFSRAVACLELTK